MAKSQIPQPGAWVLTRSHNDHDQHGEYFVAVWPSKPTTEQLAEFFRYTTGTPGNVMDALHFLLHLEKGGGRRATEDVWYDLAFVEYGKGDPN